jgi:hypothetical protein
MSEIPLLNPKPKDEVIFFNADARSLFLRCLARTETQGALWTEEGVTTLALRPKSFEKFRHEIDRTVLAHCHATRHLIRLVELDPFRFFRFCHYESN